MRRYPKISIVWLAIGGAYFVLPLFATFLFSLQTRRNHRDFSAYSEVLRSDEFRTAFSFSLKLAVATILISTLLVVPTTYVVNLKLPRLRPLLEFISILPLVIPPIVLVVGLLKTFEGAPGWVFAEGSPSFFGIPPILVGGYVILALPYVYRSVDVGLRAIDIHTLTDASLSLGAGWTTTLVRVIAPNLRAAVINGAFLTLTIVLGEFTLAQLMQFTSFNVYIAGVGRSNGTNAAALSVIAFAVTWVLMLLLLLVVGRSGGRRRAPTIGGAR
jgi:putative spermidine/putrescine transport system permease protein